MIFTQSSFYMQEILQTSGCVSICLPLWKDVKSPQSSARQLSAHPSLTSPRTTLRATGPSHCCASHSSCLKRWSMDVSTPSLIPSYRMNKLASTRMINRRPGYTANTGHWGLFWGQRDSLRCPNWSDSSIWYYVAPRVYLKAPLDAAR